jgi:hypothetical protein
LRQSDAAHVVAYKLAHIHAQTIGGLPQRGFSIIVCGDASGVRCSTSTLFSNLPASIHQRS